MEEVSVQELREILAKKEKNVAVIDVRTSQEYGAVCIGGVTNKPLDEIEQYADELKKFDAVYVHCHSGSRSAQACERLAALGLVNTVNVRGGIAEWEREGFEVCRGISC